MPEILGLPPRTPLRIVSLEDRPMPHGTQGDLDGLMHDALRSCPDLLASLAALRGSEENTARVRAALYPTAFLNVKTGGDAEEWAMQQVALAYDELDTGFSQFDAAVTQQQVALTAFDANVEAFRRGTRSRQRHARSNPRPGTGFHRQLGVHHRPVDLLEIVLLK